MTVFASQNLVSILEGKGHVRIRELELIPPTGEHLWVLLSASTLNFEGSTAFIAPYEEITE